MRSSTVAPSAKAITPLAMSDNALAEGSTPLRILYLSIYSDIPITRIPNVDKILVISVLFWRSSAFSFSITPRTLLPYKALSSIINDKASSMNPSYLLLSSSNLPCLNIPLISDLLTVTFSPDVVIRSRSLLTSVSKPIEPNTFISED